MPHNALDLLYEIEDSRFDLDGNIDLKIFNLAEFKKLINLQKEPIEPDIEPLPFSRSTEQFLTVFRDFILLLTSIKNHPTTPREFIGDSLITPINEFMRESLDSLGKKANTSQRLNQKLCVSRLREFLNAIQYTITEKMALPLDNTQHNLLTQLHDHIKESLLFYTGHEAEEYYSPRLQIKLRYPAFKDASIELGEIYHRYAAEQAYSPTLALASSEAYAYYVRYVAKDLISPVFDTALTQADTEEEPFVKIIKQRLLGEAPLNASNRISVARWYVLETGLQAVRLLENLNQKNTTPLAQSNDPLKISVFESDFAGGMCYIKNALLDSHLTRGSEQLKLFISDTYNVLTRLGDLEKIHLGQPVDEQLTYWEKLNPFSFAIRIIKKMLSDNLVMALEL